MLNQVVTNSNELRMSSQEMAELTEKRHDSVKRTIETLAIQGVISKPQIVDGEKSANGVVPKLMMVNKRDSYVVVAQLSPEFTAKLVDRWQELENINKAQLPDFTNPAIAARAWADEVEQKMKALETVKVKDELLVAVADLNIRAGDVSIAEFAKNLAIKGLGQNNLYKWLKGRGYLQINNQPYQQYVSRGYFVMKPYEEKIKGEVKYKTMLTPRGTAWLSRVLHAEFELEGV